MAELSTILSSDEAIGWLRPGIRLRPVPSSEAPERVIFLCNDNVEHYLAWKDGDGVVHRIMTGPP